MIPPPFVLSLLIRPPRHRLKAHKVRQHKLDLLLLLTLSSPRQGGSQDRLGTGGRRDGGHVGESGSELLMVPSNEQSLGVGLKARDGRSDDREVCLNGLDLLSSQRRPSDRTEPNHPPTRTHTSQSVPLGYLSLPDERSSSMSDKASDIRRIQHLHLVEISISSERAPGMSKESGRFGLVEQSGLVKVPNSKKSTSRVGDERGQVHPIQSGCMGGSSRANQSALSLSDESSESTFFF